MIKSGKLLVAIALVLLTKVCKSQDLDFKYSIDDSCSFWVTIVEKKNALRTIVAGSCADLLSHDYLELMKVSVSNDEEIFDKYSFDVFYINIRESMFREKSDFMKFKEYLFDFLNKEFDGEVELIEEKKELLIYKKR